MHIQITSDKEFLKSLPTTPGCYIYKDKNDKILYIGKAINIKNRVSSYFANERDLQPKIINMLQLARTIELIQVDSEVEALILETNLIKKYKPKYNRMMKDDKNYVWVMFNNNKPFPKPEIVREKKFKNATYFGPYPKKFPADKVLRNLRHLFPYCSLNFRYEIIEKNGKEYLKGKESRPCLDYHIGLCNGVCAGKVSHSEYMKNINNIKRFFRGQKKEIYDDIKERMQKASKAKNYEEAAKYRDLLDDLYYVTQKIRFDEEIDEVNLEKNKQEIAIRALEQLLQRIKFHGNIEEFDLSKFRMEAYDISNIQGTNAVGSMVVFVGGKPAKDQYRKFKIKFKNTPDDFEMMREVLARRLKRSKNKDKKFAKDPELIIIDGGKGQLSAAWDILESFGMLSNIYIVGLAKREEEIFRVKIDDEGEKTFLKTILPRKSDALYLVQRIRDEAHRFAIGFHRDLRGKASTKSLLDDVPGVGEVVRKRLMRAFGSLEGIKKASKKELQTVVRNQRTVEAIKKLL